MEALPRVYVWKCTVLLIKFKKIDNTIGDAIVNSLVGVKDLLP